MDSLNLVISEGNVVLSVADKRIQLNPKCLQ